MISQHTPQHTKPEIKVNLLSWFLLPLLFFFAACQKSPENNLPKVLDDRLKLEVILEAPEIVTPIGLTVDDKDNIYVLESHSHFPQEGYEGPRYDRIKKGIDKNDDGRPDKWIIYADSIDDGMNLFWFEGKVFLVEKDSIFSLEDIDNDGVADRRNLLVQMITARDVFDHAGLLGITVSSDDWVYVSRGNCAGMELKIVGTDGSFIDSYGEGGSVFRFRTDGSKVEHIARGFWNPFDIKFTKSGRLMVVDNDPDSRGPNRLLEIVPGGNYGYESLFGASGLHPFLAWNGELPGTLPYAAGIGEAPSGLIDASHTAFPQEYSGNILATIWEENSIVTIPLTSNLSSVKGESEVIVQGDSSFHPVALAANSRGDLFITDWVKRQYPNHGYGRILRLTSASGAQVKMEDSKPLSSSYVSRLDEASDSQKLISDLESKDPFIQTISRYLLVRDNYQGEVFSLLDHQNPKLRLQGLLTTGQSDWRIPKTYLRALLNDESEDIRKMTLVYLATHQRIDLYDQVLALLKGGNITSNLFETYLETVRYLQADFVHEFLSRSNQNPKRLKPKLPDKFIESIVMNLSYPDAIRAHALPYLTDIDEHAEYLIDLFPSASGPLKKQLLLALKDQRSEELRLLWKETALDISQEPAVRSQAILNLEFQGGNLCDEIKYLIKEDEPVVSETASRYLCRCGGDDEDIVQMMDEVSNPSIKNIWEHCNGRVASDRPQTDDDWNSRLSGDGNPLNGWMIFQTPKAQCISCHQVNKWGGIFGPDLSNVGASKSKKQLIRAILQPDEEIAPEWQGWYLVDRGGATHYGRQIDVGFKNAELMLADGKFRNFKDIKSFGLAPHSLMPDGLENQLTIGEMNDLLTFLISLR